MHQDVTETSKVLQHNLKYMYQKANQEMTST